MRATIAGLESKITILQNTQANHGTRLDYHDKQITELNEERTRTQTIIEQILRTQYDQAKRLDGFEGRLQDVEKTAQLALKTTERLQTLF